MRSPNRIGSSDLGSGATALRIFAEWVQSVEAAGNIVVPQDAARLGASGRWSPSTQANTACKSRVPFARRHSIRRAQEGVVSGILAERFRSISDQSALV
jgi:hypothetical protein